MAFNFESLESRWILVRVTISPRGARRLPYNSEDDHDLQKEVAQLITANRSTIRMCEGPQIGAHKPQVLGS